MHCSLIHSWHICKYFTTHKGRTHWFICGSQAIDLVAEWTNDFLVLLCAASTRQTVPPALYILQLAKTLLCVLLILGRFSLNVLAFEVASSCSPTNLSKHSTMVNIWCYLCAGLKKKKCARCKDFIYFAHNLSPILHPCTCTNSSCFIYFLPSIYHWCAHKEDKMKTL